jgi:hypothetical protein
MKEKEIKCEHHIIGYMFDYDDSQLIDFEFLKEYCNRTSFRPYWTIEQYLDKRYNTNLNHFNYCPNCGMKIDWKELKKSV